MRPVTWNHDMARAATYVKFFAPVDGNSTNALMNVVDQKVQQGVSRLTLLISTPGGSVFHGLSVYNYLAGLPIEIETHNFGSVDSIGAVIYVAGRRRYSVPDARFLMHPVAVSFAANTALGEDELAERLASVRIDTDNIVRVIAAATGKSRDELHRAMLGRSTFSADEARAFGLVHEIRRELFPAGADVVSINMS